MQIFLCTSYVQASVGDHLDAHSYLQNTGQEFDGSDSGARPDEAVSWGKIRAGAETVKVGKPIPGLRANSHPPAGLCGRDARIPVDCRCDIRPGHKVSLDAVRLAGSFL